MSNEYLTRDDLKLIELKKSKASWYNPTKTAERDERTGKIVLPETAYLGETSDGPTWEEPVLDCGLFKKAAIAFKSGNINDIAKVTVDPYIGRWSAIAQEYSELIHGYLKSGSNASLKSAGIGLSGDFSAIDIVNVQQEMVNTELRDFVLEQAVTTVATPNLLLSVDTYTRFTGQKSIGEGVPPATKTGSVSRTTFTLPKDGTAIGLSFEAQTKAGHDLYRTHVDNAITDLKRIKSNKIATEIETAADSSAGDWAAITSDHYTRSALDDIGTVTDIIVSNNGRADTLAMHDRVARDLISNLGASAIAFDGKDANVMSQLGNVTSTARVFQIPASNLTAYVDNEKTNTICSVYDKRAIYKMQGPVRTAVFRDEMADVDMFRVFDFNLPKLIIAGRARDLTSVSA